MGKVLWKQYTDAKESLYLSKQAQVDLSKLKQSLLDNTRWHTSDGALAVAVIGETVRAFCNFFLALVPEKNPLDFEIKGLYETVQLLLLRGDFSDWDSFAERFAEAHTWAGIEDRIINGSFLRQAVLALVKLGTDIAALPDVVKDHARLKEEVRQQLDRIEQEYKKYENLTSKSNRVNGMFGILVEPLIDYIWVHEEYEHFLTVYG